MKTTSAPVQLSRRLTRRVPTENGGFKTEDSGTEYADAILTIDFDGVAELLGPKALRSKRGKASAMYGAITLRVFSGSRRRVI